jgi:hypothetical protein
LRRSAHNQRRRADADTRGHGYRQGRRTRRRGVRDHRELPHWASPDRAKTVQQPRVEQGGIGAGTVIRFDMKILGSTTHFRAIVSEPEPGRVLVERNVEGNEAVSTFVVDPDAAGKTCQVTIHTEMPVRGGLAGVIEKFMVTRVLTSLYKEELKRLEAASQQPA